MYNVYSRPIKIDQSISKYWYFEEEEKEFEIGHFFLSYRLLCSFSLFFLEYKKFTREKKIAPSLIESNKKPNEREYGSLAIE